jgi:hypothetical protein
MTRKDVLAAPAEQVGSTSEQAERQTLATQLTADADLVHLATTPLLRLCARRRHRPASSPALGSTLERVSAAAVPKRGGPGVATALTSRRREGRDKRTFSNRGRAA